MAIMPPNRSSKPTEYEVKYYRKFPHDERQTYILIIAVQ